MNSASNGTTLISVTTRRPILSIRPAVTLAGQPNRGWILPTQLSLRTSGNDLYWEIVVNGTLTGAAWTPLGGDSLAESDVAATAITGGTKIFEGYSVAGSGAAAGNRISGVFDLFPIGVDSLTNIPTHYTIVGTSMAATSTTGAAASWREIY